MEIDRGHVPGVGGAPRLRVKVDEPARERQLRNGARGISRQRQTLRQPLPRRPISTRSTPGAVVLPFEVAPGGGK
jgi:hypothetical protein